MYVELVSVDTIIVSLWNTMRNHTSHNVDITCAVAPLTHVPVGHTEITLCQWDTKETMKYASGQYNASVRFSSWTLPNARPGTS